MEQEIKRADKNIAVETMLIGAMYKNPDLYVEFGKLIVSKYDFADDATRFFYDNFAVMYETFSQDFNETNVNAWMTQEKERLKKYKLYSGYTIIKTWMDLAVEEDFKNYFNIVKKFSLVREYSRQGFPAERILAFDNFEKLTAKDIYRLIRSKADRIFTVIDGDEESRIINDGMVETVESLLVSPDLGLPYPFEIINELFKGMSEQTFITVGMPSNFGKSRLMLYIAAYVSLVLKEKTFIMINEMTEKQLRYALITTVLNCPVFQKLHGVNIQKCEKEITIGLYKDNDGNYITRYTDTLGKYTESEEDYIERLKNSSLEFNQVLSVAKWIEDETEGRIFVKEMVRYDDTALEFEIRKAVLINNIKYVYYDTLKNNDSSAGDWSMFKLTATKLKQLANELKIYIYGSIQMTDSTHYTDPLALNSNNISESKAIKHLMDMLLLCKQIDKSDYHKYQILQSDKEWGSDCFCDLDYSKIYYVFVVDKNRKGRKSALAFEVNLDENCWQELGILVKKPKNG